MTLFAGRSDPGRVRSSNEDALIMDAEAGLFAVCDGMGGHNAGEEASRIAVDTLAEFVRTSRHDSGITWPFGFNTTLPFEANQIQSAVQLANQHIRYQAQRDASLDGMGSTIIAVLLRGSTAYAVNVGDSRLYRWRHGSLEQLSEDDSWAATMLKSGATKEFVENHQMRHVLTRALGSDAVISIDVFEVPLEIGDTLLLCSDGLHGPLGAEGIARVLAATGTDDIDAAASSLVDAANAAGGPDNVTAVLVRYAGTPWTASSGLMSETGQSTSEYIVTAGVLVVVGIMASNALLQMFRTMMNRIAYDVQFLAP